MKPTASDLNPIHQSAVELWSLGLSVIPLKPIDPTGADPGAYKKPAIPWASYQSKQATPDELHEWFEAHANRGVAIVTGRVSGIIAVDVDDPDLRDWLLEHLPATPVRTDTYKGEHWLYRYPAELGERELGIRNKVRIRLSGQEMAVDLRADGGYIVAPGTAHPPKDGKSQYTMIDPWALVWDQMPMMPMTFLDAIRKAAPAAATALTPVAIRQPIAGVAEQARRYLSAIPGAVQGSGGDTHTFTTVCKMVRGFDLSDGDAYSLLSEWNQRCSPPWTAEELQGKIAGARRYGTEQPGGRVREAPLRLVSSQGAAPAGLESAKIVTQEVMASAQKEWRVLSEEHYELRYPDLGIAFDANRLRQKFGNLCGELTVSCGLPGAWSDDDGVIHSADMDFNNARDRDSRASYLYKACKAVDQSAWGRMLEHFCRRVIQASRAGEPSVSLPDVAPSVREREAVIDGLTISLEHPTILFGDGGTCKSQLAIKVAGLLTQRGESVIYFDWELDAAEHRDRLERQFGALMPTVRYLRCGKAASQDVDRLRREVERHRATYAIFDSIVPACSDGNPMDADTVARYMAVPRTLRVGSLHLAHITKGGSERGGDNTQKPYGSAFWHNLARCTWFIERAPNSEPGMTRVGLYNRKPLHNKPEAKPFAYELHYSEHRTRIEPFELGDSPDLSRRLGTPERIKSLLRHGPLTQAQIVEELDGATESAVEKAIQRGCKDGGPFVRLLDHGADRVTKIALKDWRHIDRTA